ncbi:MAG: tyrosine-protein phosphatase [Actinomycetota bacterium]
MSATGATPGARIDLDGALNVRDLGGWATPRGPVAHGHFFRSDRLSALSGSDQDRLAALGIDTVVDLRYEAEVVADPSRLWPTVRRHLEIPMGGQLADQKSFIERVLDGELDDITDADVAQSYLDMLSTHASELGRAVGGLLEGGPGLYHCTAGKDRTGLLTMLILQSVGVADDDILTDFELSNRYRAEVRIEQLRATFQDRGLDVERFRPALSAPRPAMMAAMAWITEQHGSASRYLAAAGVEQPAERLAARLLPPG